MFIKIQRSYFTFEGTFNKRYYTFPNKIISYRSQLSPYLGFQDTRSIRKEIKPLYFLVTWKINSYIGLKGEIIVCKFKRKWIVPSYHEKDNSKCSPLCSKIR